MKHQLSNRHRAGGAGAHRVARGLTTYLRLGRTESFWKAAEKERFASSAVPPKLMVESRSAW
jgi:hypothetical protein